MSQAIKVLMVDDEEQFRATTKKILNRRGFDTILAASGEEALDRLQEHPDVVVLDIKMAGMDGHQTLKAIRAQNPDLPVIMLTGHGAAPSAREAFAEGAYDYLSKPCDIDLLAGKITDAVHHGRLDGARPAEKQIVDVMIPIADYSTLTEDKTVREAIDELKKSFAAKISTSRIMETGHRSLLVFDEGGKMKGLLAIADLLAALMPDYLSAPKPSTADSLQYSPMFWSGMFSREVALLGAKRVGEIMSPAPPAIDADANLMEAAFQLMRSRVRRMAVMQAGQVVGVIREQDLFFEIDRILHT